MLLKVFLKVVHFDKHCKPLFELSADSFLLYNSKTLYFQVPLVVEYNIGDIGYVRYYLAPKIEDDDN